MPEPFWGRANAAQGRDTTGVLLVNGAGLPPRAVPVDRSILLGRDDTNDIVLRNDRVSRRHARVWPHGHGLALEDLGSSNGTSVNGRRVFSVVQLQDGDTLTLGDVDIEICLPGMDAVARAASRTDVGAAGGLHTGRAGLAEPPIGDTVKDHGAKTLALAVLESLVGTALSQAIGTGLAGTYAFAAIAPLLGTIFALRKNGRMRAGAVLLVTAIAVVVTVVGVTAADTALGRSVFPWSNSDRTFVPPPDSGSDTAIKLIMPELVGENNVSAMQLLDRYGFHSQNVLFVQTPAPSKSFGKVMRTQPPAGAKVPEDAIVRIYIAVGGTP